MKKVLLAALSFILMNSTAIAQLSDEKIDSNEGKSKKVTKKETIKPIVIIQPKSIIGFISLNIKDKNAQMVVSTVYKIGNNICLLALSTTSPFESSGLSFFNCKNRTVK